MNELTSATGNWKILIGDARVRLDELQDESVDLTVTSVPYFNLRDYCVKGQIGLENSPQELVDVLVGIFAKIRIKTKKQGCLFVNVGDNYAHNSGHRKRVLTASLNKSNPNGFNVANGWGIKDIRNAGLKVKDMVGFPWMLAFALRDEGWYLRNEIIWYKPNARPEPPRGRFAVNFETIFFFTKSRNNFFDHDAVRSLTGKEATEEEYEAGLGSNTGADCERWKRGYAKKSKAITHPKGALRRAVWSIPTWKHPDSTSESGYHSATFPPDIPRMCIASSSPEGGLVLDPFSGMGTTGIVANALRRNYVGIELNPKWAHRSAHWLEVGYEKFVSSRVARSLKEPISRDTVEKAFESKIDNQLKLFRAKGS